MRSEPWRNRPALSGKPTLMFSPAYKLYRSAPAESAGLQARSKDQEILEEGGGAGPSLLPRRDHE